MTVNITKINDKKLLVNTKPVYKNEKGNWISKNLNTKEAEATSEYIAALEKFIENTKK